MYYSDMHWQSLLTQLQCVFVLLQARLKLREKQEEMGGGQPEEESVGVKVVVRELDDVLFRDVGNKMANDGRYGVCVCLCTCKCACVHVCVFGCACGCVHRVCMYVDLILLVVSLRIFCHGKVNKAFIMVLLQI